jgi:deoxyribodipyrimidine photo-lyase
MANAPNWRVPDPHSAPARIQPVRPRPLTRPIIVWFRQDLRLSDNPALVFAGRSGRPLICLFILDDHTPGQWKWGGASRCWLHHSLAALDQSLNRLGGGLVLHKGIDEKILMDVVKDSGAEAVVWNRCYEPFAVARDARLKQALTEDGVSIASFNASLLFEPWEISTRDGKPFRVFTPFWNALRNKTEVGRPLPAPRKLNFQKQISGNRPKDWNLLPSKPDWAQGFKWKPGEASARKALDKFLDGVGDYNKMRDCPALDGTSSLSPHLHWGEISPRQVWHRVKASAHGRGDGAQTFLRELGWREFCHQLLFHHPSLPEQPLDRRFETFPWRREGNSFRAWTRGQTGIPIVDAGMRQLWQTGWMHNRVRMIAASFLIKHLGIDWREGESWFWETLVDADLANNAVNWQWVAGCGADAAPFFRIFNPVLQGEKFDCSGGYVRKFIPELAQLPDKYIHRPWDAPYPPGNYPAPIVDLAEGRARALVAFKALKA